MDPLSISASVVTFVQLAMQIKASVDKIGRNRQRMCELSEDILAILVDLRDFYEANSQLGQDVALGSLKRSFDRLKDDLSEMDERCQRHLNSEGKGKLQKLARHWKAWKDADGLEADLARLREKIHSSLIHSNLFISARNEVAIARLEHNVLLSPATDRWRVRQFDSILGQRLCERASDLSALNHPSPPTDETDCQYVRLKSRSITGVLKMRPSAISLSLESDPFKPYPLYLVLPNKEPSPPILMETVGELAEIWQSLHSVGPGMVASCSLDSILRTTHNLSVYGCHDVALVVVDIAEGILKRALRSDNSQHDHDIMLSWLAFIISWRLVADPDRDQTKLTMEWVSIRKQQLGYINTSSTLSMRRLHLHYALQQLARVQFKSLDFNGCLSSCAEALELLRHDAPSESCNQADKDATLSWYCTSQMYASTLFTQACAFAANGDLTRAHYTGLDAIAAIDRLSTRQTGAPENFSFLHNPLSFLKNTVPSWASAVRNSSSSSIESVDEESSDSNPGVEWGVAC